MHHQLGGSTEDDMNKMSVIGHISLYSMSSVSGAGIGPILTRFLLFFVNEFLSVIRQKKLIINFWDLNQGPKSRLQSSRGPTSGWSETEEYRILLQFQLPFAKNIIAYVCRKCENLVGVMVFGHKAAHNILPWLRMKFSQKILIQNVFLSHPQNIKWRYTLEHSRNYVETCNHESSCLGVDI